MSTGGGNKKGNRGELGCVRVELAFRPASKALYFCHPDEAFRPRRDLRFDFFSGLFS